MPLREFSDPTGRVWQAWSTVPGNPHEAAAFATNARSVAEGGAQEAGEHRAVAGASVSPGLEHGWLTFQAGDDKRRLSPIPSGWATASDAELAEYLTRAAPVRLSDAAARLLRRSARDADG